MVNGIRFLSDDKYYYDLLKDPEHGEGAFTLKAGRDAKDAQDMIVCSVEVYNAFFNYYKKYGIWPDSKLFLTENGMAHLMSDHKFYLFGPDDVRVKHCLDQSIKYDSANDISKMDEFLRLQPEVKTISFVANQYELPEEYCYLYSDARVSMILSLFINLEKIHLYEGCTELFERDGILYTHYILHTHNESIVNLFFCPPAYPKSEINVDQTVRSVESYAFAGNINVKTIKFANVTYISTEAFLNAKSLTEITLGDSYAVIEEDAFRGCRSFNISSINLRNVQRIYKTSFASEVWPKLVEVLSDAAGYHVNDGEITQFGCIGDNAWVYTDGHDVHVVGKGPTWDFSDNSVRENVTRFNCEKLLIHEGITYIGRESFTESSFTSADFAESVKKIASFAFFNTTFDILDLPGSIKCLESFFVSDDPYGIGKLIISCDIECLETGAFYQRYGAPYEIVLTGDQPPKDWIMWIRSDLFWDIDPYCETIYYPESWKGVFTHEYFDEIRKKVNERDYRGDFDAEFYSFFDSDVMDSLQLIDKMESDILNETSANADQDNEKLWKPYSDLSDLMVANKEEQCTCSDDDYEEYEEYDEVKEEEDDSVHESFSDSAEFSDLFEFFVNTFYEALNDRAKSLPDFEETGEELFLRRFTLELQMQQDHNSSTGMFYNMEILRRKFKQETNDEEYKNWKEEYLKKVSHDAGDEWITFNYGNPDLHLSVTVLAEEAEYALLNCKEFGCSEPREASAEEIRDAIADMNRSLE